MSASLNHKLRNARDLLQNGDSAAARALCDGLLRQAPRNPEALLLRGIAALMQGAHAQAAQDLQQAKAAAPRDGAILEHLGLAQLNLGAYAEAETVLRQASGLPGAPASVWMRLGLAILHQGRAAEAVPLLREAVARAPGHPDCLLSLGRGLAAAGDTVAAAACFADALRAAPGHPDALFNLGVLHLETGELDAAARRFAETLAVEPRHVEAMINLAVVLDRQNRSVEAENQLERALAIAPGHPHAHSTLGQMHLARGMPAAAREAFAVALAADPALAVALEGMGAACRAGGRHGEAAHWYSKLVAQNPDDAAARIGLADSLLQTGKVEEAEAMARHALQLDPLQTSAYGTLALLHIVRGALDDAIAVLEQGIEKTGDALLLATLSQQARHMCDWPRWRAAWARLEPLITGSQSNCGTPFPLLGENLDRLQLLDYTRRWARQRFGPAADAVTPMPPHDPPNARLRIGYFSSDFQDHPAAYLIAEVFELHDRSRFEVYAYSYGPASDSPMRHRLRAAVDHFIDIAWETDDAVVERIRSDRIDILIDLKGYTLGDRLAVMARRPSPVQVTFMGYTGTTGVKFIDYLIADPFVLPPGEPTGCSEQVVYLPRCMQPIDRKRTVAEPLSRSAYGLPEHSFVFCCFNQTFKITPDLFAAWMRLLAAVPGSVLWLVDANRWATQNLRAAAVAAGIAPERLVLAPRLPLAEHLARYKVADLALDTFPYTSHTTASDALWCGCPLIALCGTTFAARLSSSILTASGLPDLITQTLAQYEAKVLEFAQNPDALQTVRARIAAARDGSPMFDTTAFARDLEALLLDMAGR